MNNSIKLIREKINNHSLKKDEDGNVIVKINITDRENFLSSYNENGKEIISADTAGFIDNITKPIHYKQNIHLEISCDDYSQKDEGCFKNAITNYYINEFAHNDLKLKNNLRISIILAIISLCCFSLLYFFSVWNIPNLLYLLFEVFSWVFAWEMVDQFFLQRHFIKVKQYKYLQLIFAKISFKKLGK